MLTPVRDLEQNMAARFGRVRAATCQLAEPLSTEDCCAQSMADASPVKWHLAHSTWFFETFVLERFEPNFAPFDPAFRVLFNSYYHGVGAQHPRPQRGLITRPDLASVLRYRAAVDERMQRLLARCEDAACLALIELGLQHEQQHQELVLMDIKHLLSCHPLWPMYRTVQWPQVVASPPAQPAWISHLGGLEQIGHAGEGFGFDNESPRHRVYLEPFALCSRLVTNGDYLGFMQDGGYEQPALWLAQGWDWREANTIHAPQYWRRAQGNDDALWREFTLHGAVDLALQQPVVHLSYFEADAYARWSGARLPTEAEWEAVAQAESIPFSGQFADSGVFHPAAEQGAPQLFGNVWQWTRSSYDAYPGFTPAGGAVGEYNGKFMVNQYVLRGGSCATPSDHIRASYRNFFPTTARWQFAGVRLARDL
ncbi:ergothioneine biosynthesis protein EgtB [Diaphorobacter sp. HDW4A]|uniref:ergothioneine biosynthesis protein EgtB n=1 Tax=Diaphorobacter sp. HDW4A TaxID=2714924 RepID=UPI00140A4F6E|nr:ergothioneine biosynthesis protein EgtB [Diaphorobacter sp. HDW4A]QIL80597.1 ergothioneine biosynthesis protein EgtB [Diaphorobacter sp. HDW4A]